MKRILLVEDEEHLHSAIKLNLELEGYHVSSIFNGKNAIQKFNESRFDLIILDVMLPEFNGFDICQSIRLENQKVPIMFLTAKSSNEDKIKGLKMADDYLTKPFNLNELLLRVKNLIKRNIDPEITQTTHKIGDVVVDFNSLDHLKFEKDFNVNNKSVIIVSDVSQSAKTLQLIISGLMSLNPIKIKTAVMFNRDHSL